MFAHVCSTRPLLRHLGPWVACLVCPEWAGRVPSSEVQWQPQRQCRVNKVSTCEEDVWRWLLWSHGRNRRSGVGIRGNRGSWESVRAEFGETQGLRWSLRWLSLWSMMPSLASHVRMSCPEISQHIRTELWEVFQASQSQLANQQGQLYRPYAEHI